MKKINRKLFEESGKRGGLTTKKKHGVGHYKTIGKLGGKKKKAKNI